MGPEGGRRLFCYTVTDSQKGSPITGAGPFGAVASGHPGKPGSLDGPCFPMWSCQPL